MSGTPKTLFDLCGGHPALDFVNSLDNRYREDGPNEMLNGYGDLLRFAAETRLLEPQRARSLGKAVTPEAGQRALESARALREVAATVFYCAVGGKPPPGPDLRLLERYLLETSRHRELYWQTGSTDTAATRAGLVWRWERHENDAELPVWALANSVAEILLSDQMTRVRTCAVVTCRWLFLDTSKNHSRRWCNMKVCGNRMKARRFQAARRDVL
jgi:predicted RNA-binding Zn ribbon-like protein